MSYAEADEGVDPFERAGSRKESLTSEGRGCQDRRKRRLSLRDRALGSSIERHQAGRLDVAHKCGEQIQLGAGTAGVEKVPKGHVDVGRLAVDNHIAVDAWRPCIGCDTELPATLCNGIYIGVTVAGAQDAETQFNAPTIASEATACSVIFAKLPLRKSKAVVSPSGGPGRAFRQD